MRHYLRSNFGLAAARNAATFGAGDAGKLWVGSKATGTAVTATFGTDLRVEVRVFCKVLSGSFLTTSDCSSHFKAPFIY